MPCHHCKTCRSRLHAEDTHAECVSCLGKSHADAALSGTDCSHSEFQSCLSALVDIFLFRERLRPSRSHVFLFLDSERMKSSSALWRRLSTNSGSNGLHLRRPRSCQVRGLAGHPRCVRVGNDYGKTRLYSPIRSKTTALPRCARHHAASAQWGRSSPQCRGDESSGKRSHRNRSSSPERVRLLQPLLPRPQKDGGLF